MKESRTCTCCSKTKPLSEFHKRTDKYSDGYRKECKACRISKDRFRKYGVTYERYLEMLKEQGNSCKICKISLEDYLIKSSRYKYFSVDHDHATGKVRGLLCTNCNAGIGFLQDDPDILREAISYLG